jgi:hypothetical protein
MADFSARSDHRPLLERWMNCNVYLTIVAPVAERKWTATCNDRPEQLSASVAPAILVFM